MPADLLKVCCRGVGWPLRLSRAPKLVSDHHKHVLPEWLFVVASFLVVHGRFGTAEVHMGAPGPLRVPDTGFLNSHVYQGGASA